MALVSLNPMTINQLAAAHSAASGKYVLIIDNCKYHTLTDEKKATVKEWYVDFIPEAEIDEIFAQDHIFYQFGGKNKAVDAGFEWFPQPSLCPDLDHWIHVMVVCPDGQVPYENKDAAPPA